MTIIKDGDTYIVELSRAEIAARTNRTKSTQAVAPEIEHPAFAGAHQNRGAVTSHPNRAAEIAQPR